MVNTIDADGHIVEKDADVRKHLSEPHCKRGPLLPSDGMDTNMGGLVGGMEHVDISTRLKDMDKEGIDVSVLFPTSSFAVNSFIERDYAIAYACAYNDFIAEVCRQSPRLKGIALLPFQDPAAAVQEANRAITKLGLAAIAVATQGMKEHLGSQVFWPIYEELQRLNVPLCVHNRREGPAGEKRFDSFIFMHTIGRPVETFIQFAGLMYGGVAERFPDLRVAFLECGVGWVPYWIERMDEEWEKRGKVEAPLCKKKPSEYLSSENIYYGCEPEEKMISYVVGEIGSKTLMYASDYPHWDMSWPESASILWNREDLSLDVKKDLLLNNAKRFYNLS